MAAIVRLEDGRGLCGSSVSIDGLLSLIADHVEERFAEFKLWLKDKAGRPAPFLDFDVGGLDSEIRTEFYAAARRAYSVNGDQEVAVEAQSHAIQQLWRLLKMKERIDRGESPLSMSDFDRVLESYGHEDQKELWT